MQCPRCGGRIEGPGSGCKRCARAAVSVLDEHEPRLARAHLLRMRGQWDEAVEQCVEVLRLDPANPTAHSLLGDVYQDQGRPEEARHWYQLALELNPASDADRAKLARAEEALEARHQRAEWDSVISGRTQPVATKLLVRETLQRIVALVGAGLCALILAMAAVVSATEGTRLPEQEVAPLLTRPGARARQPVVVDSARERQLKKLYSELPQAERLQVVDLEIHPVTQAVEVHVLLPRGVREKLATAELKLRARREGYRVAQAIRQLDPRVSPISIRLFTPTDGARGRYDLLWMGTLPIERLHDKVDPDLLTPQELEQFYAEAGAPEYWAPDHVGQF